MRRLRLAILGSSPCQLCSAACCKQNGHDYAVLLLPEEWRKFAPFCVDAPIAGPTHTTIEKVLPYRDGRCQFLGADDRCTIYEDRPTNCRRFECIPGYHHRGSDLSAHSDFLQNNPKVREMLEGLREGIDPEGGELFPHSGVKANAS